MMRLFGAALVAAGCGAAGLGAVSRLDNRARDLRELSAGLAALQRELCWRLSPLGTALKAAARETHGRAAQFFAQCAQGVEQLEGRPFQQVWQEGIESCLIRLAQEDREVLEQLGPVLGRYDADSQRQAIEGAGDRLGRQLAQAAEDRRRLGRVYGVLGMTVGLFLVILLL